MNGTSEVGHKGRFAPSPTGPLHFGSLIAAVGSYLQARIQHGQWLVRMEDLDPPREQPGAADLILLTLDRYGFQWDGEVMYQSRRTEAYKAALRELERAGITYYCTCSRKKIAELVAAANGRPGVYPGHCRNAATSPHKRHAVRVLTEGGRVAFSDLVQGVVKQDLASEVGDFVIRRADGLFAYQLAVVVDDAAQGITDVVRGSDLLDSTGRQLFLQEALGLPSPTYLHLPVIVDSQGEKLSKQTHAPPLDLTNPVPSLWSALRFLGQSPPGELQFETLDCLWQWALANWNPANIPRRQAIALSELECASPSRS